MLQARSSQQRLQVRELPLRLQTLALLKLVVALLSTANSSAKQALRVKLPRKVRVQLLGHSSKKYSKLLKMAVFLSVLAPV
jgi:hypothetical protein